jgi:hypothetical protein
MSTGGAPSHRVNPRRTSRIKPDSYTPEGMPNGRRGRPRWPGPGHERRKPIKRGGMIAHVLTFGAHNRTLVVLALKKAGIEDLG